MEHTYKVAILKKHPLFAGVTEHDIERFAQKTKEKVFLPKTIILNQADPADAVYIMYKGLVRIYMLNGEGRIIPIRIRGPRYLIGEMNLFDNESTANIEAIQETYTLMCRKEDCIDVLKHSPIIAFNLLKILNEKLRAANKQTNHYFSLGLMERTVNILHSLAPHFPNNEILVSQEEISYMIGATRPRVTEILACLVQKKVIVLSRRNIRVL